ncbi:protein ATP6V1FNB isoform X1 [Mustela erminea]|uniref:protein ATP6V1FNB isoform X1 n=1 Tax=Mustela erminea TaxID=36723 RepID=UPI0013866DAE|nr:protein ATP6V1FNB isoform X1 [Mustela erminea]
MRDLCTTQSQAYWRERIQKETTARVTWKINYGHKYLKEGPMPRKRLQRAPLRLALGAGPLPATSAPESKEIWDGWPETKGVRDQLSKGVGVQGPPPKGEKAWEAQRAPRGPAVQTRPGGLEMRQVPAGTLRLLFQGISHDGQGRASYLRERHRQKPEEKFLYPVLSSWEYGWHMGDIMKDTRAPTYARCQPISKTFYIKSSVFHFPRRTDQLS